MFPCSFKAPSRNMHKMNEYLRNVLLTPKLKKKKKDAKSPVYKRRHLSTQSSPSPIPAVYFKDGKRLN